MSCIISTLAVTNVVEITGPTSLPLNPESNWFSMSLGEGGVIVYRGVTIFQLGLIPIFGEPIQEAKTQNFLFHWSESKITVKESCSLH